MNQPHLLGRLMLTPSSLFIRLNVEKLLLVISLTILGGRATQIQLLFTSGPQRAVPHLLLCTGVIPQAAISRSRSLYSFMPVRSKSQCLLVMVNYTLLHSYAVGRIKPCAACVRAPAHSRLPVVSSGWRSDPDVIRSLFMYGRLCFLVSSQMCEVVSSFPSTQQLCRIHSHYGTASPA